ncbi:MAG: flagellar hook-associated protein 3, partial [Enterobacterales bacterium]|nr:flagellar hook-associated protein 3 [Enterobacterales bacterium]
GSGIINAGTVTDQTSYVRDTYQIDFVDIGGGVVGYDVTDSGGAVIASNVPYVDGDDISFNGLSVSIDGSPDIGDNFSINPSVRQDLFTTIQESIATLRINVSTPEDSAYLNNQLQNSLINLDQAMRNIGFIQAQVGTRLNIAESQKFINEDFNLTSKTTLSTIRDLDMAEAISDLNLRSISLEAAQASFARVQNLSLFNFLR